MCDTSAVPQRVLWVDIDGERAHHVTGLHPRRHHPDDGLADRRRLARLMTHPPTTPPPPSRRRHPRLGASPRHQRGRGGTAARRGRPPRRSRCADQTEWPSPAAQLPKPTTLFGVNLANPTPGLMSQPPHASTSRPATSTTRSDGQAAGRRSLRRRDQDVRRLRQGPHRRADGPARRMARPGAR